MLMGHRPAPPTPIRPHGPDGSGALGQLLDGLILLASAAVALAGVVALYVVWLDETPWWGAILALAMLGQLALIPALLGVSRKGS
jgi:hypothetical protein